MLRRGTRPKSQKHSKHQILMQKWGCRWDVGATGSGSWFACLRVQESAMVHTLECCSCLGAGAPTHNLGKRAVEVWREGDQGKGDTQKRLERSTKGSILPLGGLFFSPCQTSLPKRKQTKQKKKKKNTKNPNTTSNSKSNNEVHRDPTTLLAEQ